MGGKGFAGEGSPAGRVLLGTSLALYAVSFALPALQENGRATRGLAAFLLTLVYPLLYGAIGVVKRLPGALLMLAYFPCWLANVAYWLAVYRLSRGRRRGVGFLGCAAVLLGLTVFAPAVAILLHTPPGARSPGVVFREGYWLWLAGMGLVAFAGRTRAETLPRDGDD